MSLIHVREKKPIALIHVREKKPIALIHVREKKHIALIHVREKDIIMDALTRMLEKEWSRGTAHFPGVWRRGTNKLAKRELVSLLISDKEKKTVSVLGHFFCCHTEQGPTYG